MQAQTGLSLITDDAEARSSESTDILLQDIEFDADAMAFRTTFRMDGQPKLAAPITPAKGSNTLSPFVQLAAR